MTENEFILMDRIQKIKSINEQYDLERNAYISFSGGRDSTILHHLIDEALPGNKIPRVYINTGIEYKMVLDFVRKLAKEDDRVIIYNAGVNLKLMLEEKGYPFKSKEHSHHLAIYQHSGRTKSVLKYIGLEKGNRKILCPNALKFQFSEPARFKVSDLCCSELKKKTAKRISKELNKTIVITGMRSAEGGQRTGITCTVFDEGKLKKFHPLAPIAETWEKWYEAEKEIKLCDLYYPPFNFTRTGCKGCPFALNLQDELDTMQRLLPNEYKQAWFLWAPVYNEYKRIGYRLRAPELFD